MAGGVFLGSPPPNIKQWIVDQTWGNPKTVVKYLDGTVSSFDIVGTLSGDGPNGYNLSVRDDYVMTVYPTYQISNVISAVEIKVGTDVTSIVNDAFEYCVNLTSITIPSSVVSLSDYVFDMQMYQFQDGHSIQVGIQNGGLSSIGKYAFYGARDIKVVLPDSVVRLDDDSFCYARILELGLPRHLSSIGKFVFEDMWGVSELVLPSSVVDIDYSAFKYWSGRLIFEGKTLSDIGSMNNYWWRLYDGSQIVGTDGSYEFTGRECQVWLRGVENSWAGMLCEGMITQQFVQQLGIQTAVEMLFVGTAVEGIASYALAGCTILEELAFPSGFDLTTIQTNAFFGCDSLNNIQLFGAYKGSMSDETVYQMARQYGLGVASDGTTFQVAVRFEDATVYVPSSVPPMATDTVVQYANGTISSFAISGMLSGMGDGVPTTQIPNVTSAVDITIGSLVSALGNWTFENCSRLSNVTIPGTVRAMGGLVFDGYTTNLHFLTRTLEVVTKKNEYNAYAYGLDGYSLIYCTDGTTYAKCDWETTIVIQNTPYDYPIEGDVSQALVRSVPYQYITGINIGMGVTGIDSYAAEGCGMLQAISLPYRFNLGSIQQNAFFGCDQLTGVWLFGYTTSEVTQQQAYQLARYVGLGVASDQSLFSVTLHLDDGDIVIPAS